MKQMVPLDEYLASAGNATTNSYRGTCTEDDQSLCLEVAALVEKGLKDLPLRTFVSGDRDVSWHTVDSCMMMRSCTQVSMVYAVSSNSSSGWNGSKIAMCVMLEPDMTPDQIANEMLAEAKAEILKDDLAVSVKERV